jgi:hypothetical protein
MRCLQFSAPLKCNWSATAALLLLFAKPIGAQPATADPAQPDEHVAVDVAKFLAGGASAFVLHEGGHLFFDILFDAKPFVTAVHFGPIPFFAVSHERATPTQEFIISSAGFWTQEATSEWLLTTRPDIRHEHAPFAKGVLAFDVLTSIGYGTVAMFKAGPAERDTRGMAAGLGVDERAIGALVMAPALLDAYRYARPSARWPVWTSRAVKLASVLLVLKQTSSDHR